MPLYVAGLDLSGPCNADDTSLVLFETEASHLRFVRWVQGADDQVIFEILSEFAKMRPLAVGIDAPLSYRIGGGDRPADSTLRRRLVQLGLKSGSVMPPTMTRMAYLTLRGMAVSRMLERVTSHCIRIVEVHPGGAMALRGAPIEDVLGFRSCANSRLSLLKWLARQGLRDLPAEETARDHDVAASAAVLAAWQWHCQRCVWLFPAAPPDHPYDFAC